LVTSEGVDKAFWVDAVVLLLGEGAEAVRAKQRALNMSKVSQQLA
jgi:hypothetical protein